MAKKTIKIPLEVLQHLMEAGRLMSNVCYNLSQRESIPGHERQSMSDLTRKWDAHSRNVSSYFPHTIINGNP